MSGLYTGFATASTVADSGTSSGTNATLEVVLDLPCGITVASYVQAKRDGDPEIDETVGTMTVYGSSDGGTTWTELGSFLGETWSQSEMKTFSADATLGTFSSFKFWMQKVSKTANDRVVLGEIALSASAVSAATCNQAMDTEPNILGTGVLRVDFTQMGVTGDTAVFTYSCDYGYATASGSTAVTFTYMADAGGSAFWKGTPPTCLQLSGSLVLIRI
uniref:F5/8 type C domain-containing protein n=1 Tax=Chromera velia CCMP2878 TaxID=1169474 RepID=A0A0G4H497_9ALVE|eukprot:Cvel_5672.t1-p1 / transcript=Cvel_5672.t1 / gene=Cvel_5672 / organism=Chromera_velia_CCMP2878 / gene_product=hypothetical protein / transcript_product=hypothetical protein / location=Cvel_scaffold267:106784-107768(+) / protein_length=217 / sequence_SO=supercontig / SO=protein_coding / is_pseudo=false